MGMIEVPPPKRDGRPSFGPTVRARRTELGIGLNDFSARLGISPAYWSRIERELEKPPRDELIERAAAILGIRLDELFVHAQRLPPDMQRDLDRVVLAYRRMRAQSFR
jgi:transcriptional regulator with XRE-family HTH domain